MSPAANRIRGPGTSLDDCWLMAPYVQPERQEQLDQIQHVDGVACTSLRARPEVRRHRLHVLPVNHTVTVDVLRAAGMRAARSTRAL